MVGRAVTVAASADLVPVLASAVDGKMDLINMPDKSPAQSFEADTLLWTAGVHYVRTMPVTRPSLGQLNPVYAELAIVLVGSDAASASVGLCVSGEAWIVIDSAGPSSSST